MKFQLRTWFHLQTIGRNQFRRIRNLAYFINSYRFQNIADRTLYSTMTLSNRNRVNNLKINTKTEFETDIGEALENIGVNLY